MGRLLGIALDFDLEKKKFRIEAAGNGVREAKMEYRAAQLRSTISNDERKLASLEVKVQRAKEQLRRDKGRLLQLGG